MAKKKTKSSPSSRRVHPLHRSHSISGSFKKHPVLTLSLIAMILLFVGIIYISLLSPFVAVPA